MSRTYHHHAPPRCILVKHPTHYTGWLFEGATRAPSRRWVKRMVNKASRRVSKLIASFESDAVFTEGLSQDRLEQMEDFHADNS